MLCNFLKDELAHLDIAVVPEIVSILFQAGFPRICHSISAQKNMQRAIYSTQRAFEDALFDNHPQKIVLCDRGSLDGAVFWPEGEADYFYSMHTTQEAELARYDAVLFLDTVATGSLPAFLPEQSFRIEDPVECIRQNEQLAALYRSHKRFYHVPVHVSMMGKLVAAQGTFYAILRDLQLVQQKG